MNNKGKVVIVGNKKGGAAKSTIESFFLNYLHVLADCKVLAIDADEQQTLINWRKTDIENGAQIDKLYHIESANPLDVPEMIDTRKDEYDFIFIDLPGNMREDGVREIYYEADILIVPHSISSADIEPTSQFIDEYINDVLPIRKQANLETKIKGILSRVDTKMKEFSAFQELIKMNNEKILYPGVCNDIGFPYLSRLINGSGLKIDYFNSYISENRTIFQRGVSTYQLYEGNLKKTKEFNALYTEFLKYLLD